MIDIFNMEFLAAYGYIGLFISAFLAATIVPIGAEIILTALIANKYNFVILVVVATAGNVLGALVNYFVGIKGGTWFMKKVIRLSAEEIELAENRFKKYGNGVLLFAWVPVVGDTLTVVAGVLKTDIWTFLSLVTLGKFLRYFLVALMFMGIWK